MTRNLNDYKDDLRKEIADTFILGMIKDDNQVTVSDAQNMVDQALPILLATNFSIRVSRNIAISLIEEGDERVMCKEYGEDDDWVGLTMDDLEDGLDEDYETFELWCLNDTETIHTYESLLGHFDTDDYEYLKRQFNEQ